jgi:hypothetical protein
MTQEERAAYINNLIEEAHALAARPYNSPSVGLWVKRIKRFVKSEYGEDAVFILVDNAYDGDSVFTFEPAKTARAIFGHGIDEAAHQKMIERGIGFLVRLKSVPVPKKSY